jgi:signal transduction histidine kinase
MNILANTIDACEESNWTRTLAEIQANPNTVVIPTEINIDKSNRGIKIKDNGNGIPKEVNSQIFDNLSFSRRNMLKKVQV